jgi:hypothetical protein
MSALCHLQTWRGGEAASLARTWQLADELEFKRD